MLDAGILERHDRVDVLALRQARREVAEHRHAEILETGAEGPEGLADGELDVTAHERGDRLGAALGGHDLDVEAVLLEDALVDAHLQRDLIADRERGDANVTQLAAVAARRIARRGSGGIGAAGQGEGGGRGRRENSESLLHRTDLSDLESSLTPRAGTTRGYPHAGSSPPVSQIFLHDRYLFVKS